MDEPSNFATNQGVPTKGLETLKCPKPGTVDARWDAPEYQVEI
jgi:hypothetical protein